MTKIFGEMKKAVDNDGLFRWKLVETRGIEPLTS